MLRLLMVFVWLGSLALSAEEVPVFTARERPSGGFQLLDGDRVAFVGDTLIERAQANDCLEAALAARYPDRHVIFRNLGWSGDDVTGEARAGFGTPEDGFRQLRQQVFDFKPTVIFVAYGANASFAGQEGLHTFNLGYERLLGMLGTTKAVLVLMSPIRHEAMRPPLPNPKKLNQNRALYAEAIRQWAARGGHRFVDLFETVIPEAESKQPRLTDNGIHLTDRGYAKLARTIEEQLRWPPFRWRVSITASGRLESADGVRVDQVEADGNHVKFSATSLRLPSPADGDTILHVSGLPAGQYKLTAEGQAIAAASAEDWGRGKKLAATPMHAQAEALRQVILAKNRLFFHRWRPQNETYLFGFRKHEQGQNAKEIPMFDPLIEAREQEIAKLRAPQSHTFELVRE